MNKTVPNYVENIIRDLCTQNLIAQEQGFGPFAAAICDKNGHVIAQANNSVLLDNCSLNHAEINTIKLAQEKLNTYDLSAYDLSICITAEPCSMCLGAIMWAGIRNIYFGTPTSEVEKITGFDEGYKPDWENFFAQKGFNIIGNIEPQVCKSVLETYINSNKIVYKPNN